MIDNRRSSLTSSHYSSSTGSVTIGSGREEHTRFHTTHQLNEDSLRHFEPVRPLNVTRAQKDQKDENAANTDFSFLFNNSSGDEPDQQQQSKNPPAKKVMSTDESEVTRTGGGGKNDHTIGTVPYSCAKEVIEETEKPEPQERSTPFKRRLPYVILLLILLLVILVSVLIPVGFLVIRKEEHHPKKHKPKPDQGASIGDGSGDEDSGPEGGLYGVPSYAKNTELDPDTWMDKTGFNLTFTNETVGGLSIMGLNSSWDDSKRPNKYVPPLNEPFGYGKRAMRGVNLGGWLVLEPFITPSYFEPFGSKKDGIVDEWTLFEELNKTAESPKGAKDFFEYHYSTFITEDSFKEITEAGLDHVRIPYGYWAVKTYEGDQFLPKVSWRYLLRGIEWARKYGLRVNLDLHSVPGGQNGWNHSGRQGSLQWLNGTRGGVFGNDTIELHAQLATFFSQERYKNIVTIYGLVNEPNLIALDSERVIDWTKEAYDTVRERFDNYIVYGDGFLGAENWKGVFNETEYPDLLLDLHQYTIFDKDLIKLSHSDKLRFVCHGLAHQLQVSSNINTGHGPSMVGEWSQADNDCVMYLNNVGVGSRWEGTFDPGFGNEPVLTPSCAAEDNCTCDPSNQHPSKYTPQYIRFLRTFAEAQMDVYESNSWGFMYWTWDTESWNSTQWSYRRARLSGLLPTKTYLRSFKCDRPIPNFNSLGLPESY
ncbi:hypothetical protein TRICI_000212 [Trichomonascus ciferrii]|uniref:glucan 1,3-beta-glucosidase n=1 Tax=Trichomonascus ciferrii TaxID=44093 RepID=A0A642VDZ1_9ASCO|nr:hypothetical protein TRICI_000212 [Trichomonascus ciferrii]